jgi:hypothetical protein
LRGQALTFSGFCTHNISIWCNPDFRRTRIVQIAIDLREKLCGGSMTPDRSAALPALTAGSAVED